MNDAGGNGGESGARVDKPVGSCRWFDENEEYFESVEAELVCGRGGRCAVSEMAGADGYEKVSYVWRRRSDGDLTCCIAHFGDLSMFVFRVLLHAGIASVRHSFTLQGRGCHTGPFVEYVCGTVSIRLKHLDLQVILHRNVLLS